MQTRTRSLLLASPAAIAALVMTGCVLAPPHGGLQGGDAAGDGLVSAAECSAVAERYGSGDFWFDALELEDFQQTDTGALVQVTNAYAEGEGDGDEAASAYRFVADGDAWLLDAIDREATATGAPLADADVAEITDVIRRWADDQDCGVITEHFALTEA